MGLSEQYRRHESDLEDFWGRREHQPDYVKTFSAFGRQVRLASNEPLALESADYARVQYSSAPATEGPEINITLLVRSMPQDPGPLPENLFDHIQYSGSGRRLALQIGGWGHCQADLGSRQAFAVLSPKLGRQPKLISRYLLNTIVTNQFFADGLGMLHATGLLIQERVILLMAPHNSGKSTTALRLVLAGAKLLSDSQVYVDEYDDRVMLMGFPIGRLKLRSDVIDHFPDLGQRMGTEAIRGELKHILDLRRFRPEAVCEEAIFPSKVEICLFTRHDGPQTTREPATSEEALQEMMVNSLHYDSMEGWRRNLEQIDRLVTMASTYHLEVGTDQAALEAAFAV